MIKASATDWATILKMMAGGGLVGGGLASATMLGRHVNVLRDEAERAKKKDTSQDDNVLYINLPPGKKASANADTAPTFALGTVGALASGAVAYQAVLRAYQKHRKQQMQKELDAAQQMYVTSMDPKVKQAAFSGSTKAIGSLYTAALLAALGTAVTTNKLLTKHFPPLKDPNRDMPKKIVVRTKAPDKDPESLDYTVASDKTVTPDAAEGVLRTHLADKKASALSGFEDLVCALGQGRGPEVVQALDNGGLDLAFSVIKGASADPVNRFDRELAITRLAIDPLFSNAFLPLAAAEVHEAGPGLCKIASFIPQPMQDALEGYSATATGIVRQKIHEPVIKCAGIKKADLTEMINQLVLSSALDRAQDGQQGKTPLDTGTNAVGRIESTDDKVKQPNTRMGAEDTDALQFLQHHGDALNAAVQKVG